MDNLVFCYHRYLTQHSASHSCESARLLTLNQASIACSGYKSYARSIQSKSTKRSQDEYVFLQTAKSKDLLFRNGMLNIA